MSLARRRNAPPLYRSWKRRVKEQRVINTLRQRNRELETLHAIANIITNTLDLEGMMSAIMPRILAVTHAQAAGIWLIEPKSNQLRLIRLAGDAESLRPHLETIPTGELLEGTVARTGRGRLIRDLAREEGGRWHLLPQYRTVAAVPLLNKGEIVGVLSIIGTTPGAFSTATFRLLQRIGVQVGVGVAKALLYEAEMEQRRLAETLAESAAIVSSSLELEEVLDRLLEQAARILPADALNIMLIEEGYVRPIRWRGYDAFPSAHELPILRLPLDTYPSWSRMIRERRPVIIPEIPDEMWRDAENWRWLQSYVGAPIIVQDKVVGFFNIDGTRPHQFDEADARRLAIFARYAGTAIEYAKLYQQMRSYAQELESRVAQRVRELRQRNARLKAIFNSTDEGLAVVRQDGRFEEVNPALQRWLYHALPPTEAEQLQEAIVHMAQEGNEQEIEMTLGNLDLLLRARHVEDEEATWLITVQNITPWKAMARVQERFISTVSHELRTPITAIKLYVELLRNAPEARRASYLEALSQEVDRQAQLIEDVLRLTRIDARQYSTQSRPVDLLILLDHLIERHEIVLEKKGLRLEYHPPIARPHVIGIAHQLELVFDNLLRNAIQYTPAGGTIRIAVDTTEEQGRRWAHITVQDTGIGISPQDLPHIFKRFYRSARAQQYFPQGTGLGLAIVQEVVQHHGGIVKVESEIERGTTFHIFLPLAGDEASMETTPSCKSGQSPQEPG